MHAGAQRSDADLVAVAALWEAEQGDDCFYDFHNFIGLESRKAWPREFASVYAARLGGAIIRASSWRETPSANSERTSKSKLTERSPASIFATRD